MFKEMNSYDINDNSQDAKSYILGGFKTRFYTNSTDFSMDRSVFDYIETIPLKESIITINLN